VARNVRLFAVRAAGAVGADEDNSNLPTNRYHETHPSDLPRAPRPVPWRLREQALQHHVRSGFRPDDLRSRQVIFGVIPKPQWLAPYREPAFFAYRVPGRDWLNVEKTLLSRQIILVVEKNFRHGAQIQ
jgi:hypothetical protein